MVDLTINKVIIHALVKEQHQSIQPSQFGKKVLDQEHDAVSKVVGGVVGVYGSRDNSAHYGIFRTGEGRGDFPDQITAYSQIAEPMDEQFIELTRVAMERLYDKASANHASSGGYLIFADYSNTQGRYFLIAMIKQKPGITLTEQLEPAELMQLDLSKLNQAARISFGKLSAYLAADEDARQELNYLSFVSPSATKTASGYFVTALGCSEGAAAAQATKTLISETRKFFTERSELRPHTVAFNNSLMEYLKGKDESKELSGKTVKLSEIENIIRRHIPDHLAEEADAIANELITHLNSDRCGVPVEFPVSSSALRRFTHITGESLSWKMTFDREALGTDESAEVYFEKNSGRLILRNIPEKMREAIEEELANKGKK